MSNSGLNISLATAHSSNGQACDDQQEMLDMCLQLEKFIDVLNKRPRTDVGQELRSRLLSRSQALAELAATVGVSKLYCTSCKKDKLLDMFEFLHAGDNKRKKTCQKCCVERQENYKRDKKKA